MLKKGAANTINKRRLRRATPCFETLGFYKTIFSRDCFVLYCLKNKPAKDNKHTIYVKFSRESRFIYISSLKYLKDESQEILRLTQAAFFEIGHTWFAVFTHQSHEDEVQELRGKQSQLLNSHSSSTSYSVPEH